MGVCVCVGGGGGGGVWVRVTLGPVICKSHEL